MQYRKFSDDAPFRKYNKTDEQAFQDGVDSAKTWQPHWDHLPGGPYVPQKRDWTTQVVDPDWVEYCERLRKHNRLWLQGWHAGMQVFHRAQYKRIMRDTKRKAA